MANIIEVYKPSNTNFDYRGDATVLGTAYLTAQLNGSWELVLEIEHDDEGAWTLLEEECVIAVMSFSNSRQLYRVYNVEPSIYTTFANARPIFMDAADEIVVMDVSVNGAIPAHIEAIFGEQDKYTVDTDMSDTGDITYTQVNALGAISGDDGILATIGGEINYDNYAAFIYEQMGDDLGLTVELGKNLLGVNVVKNMDSMITRYAPVAYNGYTLPEVFVNSPNINNYAKIYTSIVTLSDFKLTEDCNDSETGYDTLDELYEAMRTEVATYFDDVIDTPTYSYSVDMLDLADVDGYEDIKSLITAHLGDTVTVRNIDMNLYVKARVIELTWDCVAGKITSIILGDYDNTIIDSINKTTVTTNTISKNINTDGTLMGGQVSGVMNAAFTSLRYQKNAAQRLDVRAILMEDTDPSSVLFGAGSFGTQGLQLAKRRNESDTDWEWGTAIDFQSIHADYVITGILSDKTGKNYWNLDTGEFVINALSDYVTNETVNADLLQVYSSISNLQAQVDGEISSWFYKYSPTLDNYPASEWTTDEEKLRHVGDTFTNTTTYVDDTETPDSGKSWRFLLIDDAYIWDPISDSDAVLALVKAGEAQSTADGKTTTYLEQPTSYTKGDMWVLLDEWNNYEAGELLIASESSTSFVTAHWGKYVSYSTENQVGALLQVLNDKILLQVSTLSGNNLINGTTNQLVAYTTGHYYKNVSGLKSLTYLGLKAGDTITFRLWLEPSGEKGAAARISYYISDTSYSTVVGNFITSDDPGYSTVTVTLPDNAHETGVFFAIQSSDSSTTTGATGSYKEAMGELGSTPTPWSAGGNVSSQISIETDLIQLNGDRLEINMTNFQLTKTGVMTCLDGIFKGDVQTTKDAYIGNNLYMNQGSEASIKYIYFNTDAYIKSFHTASWHMVKLIAPWVSLNNNKQGQVTITPDSNVTIGGVSCKILDKKPMRISELYSGRQSQSATSIAVADLLADVDNGQATSAQCWMITAVSWVASTAATSVSYLTRTNGSTAYNGITSVVKETKGPTIALSSNRQTLTITWPSSNGGTYSIVPLL